MTPAQKQDKIFNDLLRQRCLDKADTVQGACTHAKGENAAQIIWNRIDCPTCQPLAQSWRDKADKYCWHEWQEPIRNTKHESVVYDFYCSCGYVYSSDQTDSPFYRGHNLEDNPQYSTIEPIKAALEDVECDNSFKNWLLDKYGMMNSHKLFEIMWSLEPLRDKATEFMKERVG
jgi:hypothetical protein